MQLTQDQDTSPVHLETQHGAGEYYIRPERVGTDVLIAALIVCVSLLFCFLCRYTDMDGDEGIVLQGAQRVLAGQVPYRDFFTFYTPGPYYLTALLFRVFGSSLAIARIELVLCAVVFSVLTFFIARRVCSRGSALLVVYCSTLTCLPARFMVTHWDSTLFGYLALYAGIWWIETDRSVWALATGSLAAITCLFEQSAGFGVVLGLVAGLTILAARGQLRSLRRNIGPAVLGFSIPFLATFAYFAWEHSLFLMVADWFWPTLHYSSANSTPYGYTAALVKLAGLRESPWPTRVVSMFVMGPFFTIPILPIVATAVFAYFAVTRAQNGCSIQWKYYVFTSAFIFGAIVSVLLVVVLQIDAGLILKQVSTDPGTRAGC